jgi:hypothetical protein
MDPRALWEAGGATALFIAAFAAVTRRTGTEALIAATLA